MNDSLKSFKNSENENNNNEIIQNISNSELLKEYCRRLRESLITKDELILALIQNT